MNGITIDEVVVVKEWAHSKNVKVCSFPGLVGYYYQFVEMFNHIIVPSTNLTRKNINFFGKMIVKKKHLGDSGDVDYYLGLIISVKRRKIVVYNDAFRLGSGEVLIQEGKVVAYKI